MSRKWIGLFASLPFAAMAGNLQLPDEGLLLIDDGYYEFVRPGDQGVRAELRPLGANGFQLRALVAATDCVRRDGSDIAPATGLPRVLHGVTDALPPGNGIAIDGNPAQVRLMSCNGKAVLAFNTVANPGAPEARTKWASCGNRLASRPFRAGQCANLDAADAGYLFHSSFAVS